MNVKKGETYMSRTIHSNGPTPFTLYGNRTTFYAKSHYNLIISLKIQLHSRTVIREKVSCPVILSFGGVARGYNECIFKTEIFWQDLYGLIVGLHMSSVFVFTSSEEILFRFCFLDLYPFHPILGNLLIPIKVKEYANHK